MGFGLLTDRQREWVQSQLALLHSRPLRASTMLPRSRWRRLAIRVAESVGFSWVMAAVLFSNAVLLGISHWRQEDELSLTILYANIFFTAAFVVETLLGIYGRGWTLYWRLSWNRFDFFVTIASLADVIVSAFFDSVTSLSVFVSILRVTRSLRLVRIARR